jgi:hypothetical protein
MRVRSLRVTRRGISLFDARVFGSPDPPASATRYRDGVLQSRTLASYWRLGDGDTTAADAAGINHGTYRGTIPAPGLIAGGSDRARRFDGRDDFVDLRPGLFGAPPQVSVEAWFRPARARRSGREILVTDAAQAFADGFTLAVDNAGRPLFGVATRSTRRASATSPGSLKAGSTYHLAGTYDGSWLRLYVNGVERRAVRFSGGIRYLAGRDLLFGAALDPAAGSPEREARRGGALPRRAERRDRQGSPQGGLTLGWSGPRPTRRGRGGLGPGQ